jgi:hypothetical protein
MQPDSNELLHSMWIFTGGAILVLLQSILSSAKRNWWALLAGCVIGGAGSWVAAQIWGDSRYVYIICGAAAVMTENLLLGAVKASKEFANNPIEVAKTILPSLNHGTTVNVNEDTKDAK